MDLIEVLTILNTRIVIEKNWILTEDYFSYYEKANYCFNTIRNGFSLAVALDSVVYYKKGQSIETNKKFKSEFADILSLTNRIKFHKKYLGGWIGLWLGITIAFLTG